LTPADCGNAWQTCCSCFSPDDYRLNEIAQLEEEIHAADPKKAVQEENQEKERENILRRRRLLFT